MRIHWKMLALILGMGGALVSQAAELAFSSASDFTEINLELKNRYGDNPGLVQLKVTLSPEAQTRLEEVSRQAIHQQLTLFIDGQKISTATVQAVLNSPQWRISIARETALEWLSSFLVQPAPTVLWCGAVGSAAALHREFRVPCPSTHVIRLPSLQSLHALRIGQGHINCRDRLEPTEIGRIAAHCFNQHVRADRVDAQTAW